jgi:spore germination protein KC
MFSACFDYRGLEEQAIVVGIAVDAGDKGYDLSLEIVDIRRAENGQFGAVVLRATGESFAEALEDAKQKLHEEMYLGTLQLVLLSRKVAEDTGLYPFVTHLLSDLRVRSSLPLVIAQGETAGKLFTASAEEERQSMVSTVLGARLGRGNGTDPAPGLYEIYHALFAKGGEITLPAVVVSEEEGLFFALADPAQFKAGRLEREG